jgi:uncharacterized protein (TIGR04255 family)
MARPISFANAPLKEVVIGVQFSESLDNSKIYDYYKKKTEEYPIIHEVNILPTVIEKADSDAEIHILSGVHTRKQFIDSNGNRLIQIQHDKMLFNWRTGNDTNEVYPRFDNVLKEFMGHLAEFNNIHPVKKNINQLEFTYLNHIFLEDFGLIAFKLSDIFKDFAVSLPLKHISLQMSIPMPELQGSMSVTLNSGKTSNREEKKLLVLESTCRGMKLPDQTIEGWYRNAHDTLLEYFVNSITEKAKDIWKITR